MGVCYIVGAAASSPELSPREGDLVIAADAGYAALEGAGIRPDLAVGDFDSLGYVPQDVPVERHPVMKDDTDTMLAVKLGLARGFRDFRIYGGLGGRRTDHTVANIQTLGYLAARGAAGWLFGAGETMTALRDGTLSFSGARRGTLSVVALGGPARGVTLRGVLYPLSDAALAPDFPLGVSNSFTDGPAEVSVREGALLVVWSGEGPLPERIPAQKGENRA